MTYKNGPQYEGTFAGIQVRFTLQNFGPHVEEAFNKALVEEATKHVQKTEQIDRR